MASPRLLLVNARPADASFLQEVSAATQAGTLVKLTLGKPTSAAEPTLRNLYVRLVQLNAGPHLAFLYRHHTRDITKNYPPADGMSLLQGLLGTSFLDGTLATVEGSVQLSTRSDGSVHLHRRREARQQAPSQQHDRAKDHLIPLSAPWLTALGLTNPRGQPREGMAPKYRQLNKFVEVLDHLVADSALAQRTAPWTLVDMACGKGYLTFGAAAHFRDRAEVVGWEVRPALVDTCNRAAQKEGLNNLRFRAGTIAEAELTQCEVLVALHACDTATDDALARGIAAGAELIVVSPCCQKELRPQLRAPEVFGSVLGHGIYQERHAEFATDALRALLLEWSGYRTKVFEFVSTEHTAKNTMIAAVRGGPLHSDATARALRELAAFYGIRRQQLATLLGFSLTPQA